jgi:hypothetical protein
MRGDPSVRRRSATDICINRASHDVIGRRSKNSEIEVEMAAAMDTIRGN